MSSIKEEFDALAAQYETNRLSPWYQAQGEEILRQVPSLEEGDVLDIGCGTGYFLRQYLKNNPHIRGVGLDISSKMVDEANRKAKAEGVGNVKFITGDWEDIDLKLLSPYRFKIIVCASSFHYYSNPQKAACKLHELLDSQGVLYILERDKTQSLLTLFWGVLHRYLIKDQVAFYSSKELIKFLNNAGFGGVSVLRTIKRYFWKGKLFTSVILIESYKTLKATNGQSNIT
ncbi:MAG: class I SAM-dependent methyltransferase [Gammaproteobacteria bacterium]|nr:class I SAM-dependent methyltransferase [Gammaproteobacteria bacterium]